MPLLLEPQLMTLMSDGHLLASLEAEPTIWRTAVELELMRRLDPLVGLESEEDIESRLEKDYEHKMEQSDFRAQLLTDIIELIERASGSRKDLERAIMLAIEDSDVEL